MEIAQPLRPLQNLYDRGSQDLPSMIGLGNVSCGMHSWKLSPGCSPVGLIYTSLARGIPCRYYLTCKAGKAAGKDTGKCLPAPPGWDGQGLEVAGFGSAQQSQRSEGPASFGQGGILARLCETPVIKMNSGVNCQSSTRSRSNGWTHRQDPETVIFDSCFGPSPLDVSCSESR